ncbi:hypothetical protein DFH06DRAFT_1314619 [Mycena polygramma]|nr:hypothetical protein DFH06DRAFT_1314619 [Mycena polygramma]
MGDTARRYSEKFFEDAERPEVREDRRREWRRSAARGDLWTKARARYLAEDLERALKTVLEEMFPAPDEARRHEERQKKVAVALDSEKAGAALVTVCVKHGMAQRRVDAHWHTVWPAIENVVVLLGDLVEQHPDLLSALLFTGALALLPES